MMSDVTDADVCGWSEQPEKARDFVSFMRMFYVFKKDGQEDTKYGDIGNTFSCLHSMVVGSNLPILDGL